MHYYIQCTYYFTSVSHHCTHLKNHSMIALFYVICISRNNSPDQYYLPFPFETGIVVAQEGGLGSVYDEK